MVANDAMELARMCARAADDAKAENVRVYDLRGMSSLTDFMVVCTGLSVPHLRAVIRELEEAVREKAGALPTYVEDTPVALWSVVDYIDVMVHIMGQETREFYGMDTLWKDAPWWNINSSNLTSHRAASGCGTVFLFWNKWPVVCRASQKMAVCMAGFFRMRACFRRGREKTR